jgi:hypothetical protein
LIGGVFFVAPGTETHVLELCDDRRGHDLCDYVARQHRPPTLQTREGQPLVDCTTIIAVADPAAARDVLDRCYHPQDEGWVELHPINDDEQILRAQLQLDGSRLTVNTHSEPRMDRVLATLRAAMADLRVIGEQRTPLRPGELPALATAPADPIATDVNPDELVRQVQETQERRWLGEHIPALAGLTPVQAAADPSRVEQLERLLASFSDPAQLPPGAITMRPDRLRELLGLPPGPHPE